MNKSGENKAWDHQYRAFAERLKGATDVQLVGAYNREVLSDAWVSARGAYLMALKDAFKLRGIDMRATQRFICFWRRQPMKLEGKRLIPKRTDRGNSSI